MENENKTQGISCDDLSFCSVSMTSKQNVAATQLLKALNKCHKVGLAGGVFESTFYIWPKDVDPHKGNFFEFIESCGMSLRSPMSLDGGSGT